jgi:hypothetical protein
MAYGILKGNVVIAEFSSPTKVLSNEPVFSNDSLSLKRRAVRRSSQRWEIETALEPLRNNAELLMAHMVVKGSHTSFEVNFPQNFGIVSKGFAEAGATTSGIAFNTFAAISGFLGTIYEGTFVRFANHSKVYMVTENCVGNSNMKLFPALMTNVPYGTSIKYGNDVKGNFLYSTDSIKGMQYIDGVLMDNGVVKLVEAL